MTAFDGETGRLLRDRYTPKSLALGLMRGDPATFQAGYHPASAALAAQRVFGLTDSETRSLEEELVFDRCICYDLGATGPGQHHTRCPVNHSDDSL